MALDRWGETPIDLMDAEIITLIQCLERENYAMSGQSHKALTKHETIQVDGINVIF